MELFAAYQDPTKLPGKLSSRLVIALTEIRNKSIAGGVNNSGYEFGPFGIPNAPSIKDPEVRKQKLNAEIANGRLAMVAIMGLMFQNGTVGTTGPEMWLGASAFENELGVQPPTGFWDPAGYCSDGDAQEFYRRRCVEIKHGRVSMIACIGYIVPEYFKWPGYLSPSDGIKFADVPHGLDAITRVPAVGWFQIVLFGLSMELFAAYQDPTKLPGKLSSRLVIALTEIRNKSIAGGVNNSGYEFGPFGIPNAPSIKDPEVRKQKLNAEIANGRLAMVAIMGLMFQNGTVGTTGPEMWLGASAFENELGVQPPTGFWDPAGYCSDGDAQEFYRRRCVEIKHGRVSMIACIGYIVPEYFKWPGYLSPSDGIKFADVPHGLDAITRVPAVGWFQIVLFGLSMELFAAYQDPTKLPGKLSSRLVIALTEIRNKSIAGGVNNSGYEFGPFGIPNAPSIKDPEVRKQKLNAEIANGRLAMVAIMGLMFQNGTVGTTGPEMWLGASAFENELGVQPPTGFWDPAGYCSDGDAQEFYRRRCVEIKHGRVSMIACIGYIVPEYFKWPGYLSPSDGIKFADVPHGLDAITRVPAVGWFQIVLFGLSMELFAAYQDPTKLPGKLSSRLVIALTEIRNKSIAGGVNNSGYEFGPFGIPNAPSIKDPEVRKQKLNAEIANGRLAMVAIMGLMFQNGTVGTTGPEMWLGASAFENELGVQPPTGFWDPAGYCSDGDAQEFYRRRCVEIKHGRVSMIACIGYIVPEYFKWPGYLSPSDGIKFADVPHGLDAITRVPAVGWFQIVLFGLSMELFAAYQDPTKLPGKLSSRLVIALTEIRNKSIAGGVNNSGYEFGPFGIPNAPSIKDPEVRKQKLNAEIANGRLAMVAIMGLMFQNGTVGTTGPEMWLGASAFENELGVQPPTGFWDPAGYCSDGDAQEFYRRRCVEIKHGRVSMIACIGYIVPEYFKWPGYLSPSDGIKFADVPHGLDAITRVPAVGWFQIVLFGLSMELFAAYQDPTKLPGKLSSRLVIALTEIRNKSIAGGVNNSGYEFGPFGIPNAPSIKDPEVRKQKLNAEIANGRLAMVAIMGLMFQNGTVGTTGPEMWLGASAFEARRA
ncbi:unnamed protein product [Prorocentrum cordatum]|uniref:Uncharacterized protein n=1 Tax=Prorocentrum cordatum TaxID=2364126 RepID=A0ABN9XWT4_9DINO|nr:unnamed protein product [Polarella glacialis]